MLTPALFLNICIVAFLIGVVLPFVAHGKTWFQKMLFWSPISSVIGLFVFLLAGNANWFYVVIVAYSMLAAASHSVQQIKTRYLDTPSKR